MHSEDGRLLLIGTARGISLGMELELFDQRFVESSLEEWRSFTVKLEKEWTHERILQTILERYRFLYKRAQEEITKLEMENRDMRTKGVSYADRRKFTERIESGEKFLLGLKNDAERLKKNVYGIRQFMEPSDMECVKENGFGKFLLTFLP